MQFRNFPKFPGTFFSWRVVYSTNHESGEQVDLLVFSSGKREAVLNGLWLKFLWDQLARDEFELFILTLKDSDSSKWSFLKLLTYIDKKTLRKRLNYFEELLGHKISSRETYLGTRSIRIEIQKEIRRLPKPPKFSGYVRNISALGSKSRKTRFLETFTEEVILDENEFNWELALTVGDPSEQESIFTLKRT